MTFNVGVGLPIAKGATPAVTPAVTPSAAAPLIKLRRGREVKRWLGGIRTIPVVLYSIFILASNFDIYQIICQYERSFRQKNDKN
ncbi:hypothetical protein AOR13_266 [Alteromonas stellipolaris LMG 21856]|nr:hypothetical protein AOR13_266 [Alteromonas stellipolaris LMG 21856]